MGFLPSVVGIEDADGRRLDAERPDGTRAPIVQQYGEGFVHTTEIDGGITRVRTAIDPAFIADAAEGVGSAVNTIAELRALDSADLADGQSRTVKEDAAGIAFTAIYKTAGGAGIADDGINVFLSDDKSSGDPERWYRDPPVVTPVRTGLQTGTDKGRVDQLNANLLAARATLGDATATITLAQGRRRVVPTLTAPRTITLSTAGAAQGDTITIERTDLSRHTLTVVGVGELRQPGVLVAIYDTGAWRMHVAAPNFHAAVFNVKAYGAKGAGASDDLAAIQATFAALVDSVTPAHSYGVVYFPRGEYLVAGSIVLPRLPSFSNIRIVGEGRVTTQITGTGAAPTFICDQDAANTNFGVYQIEHLSIASASGQRAFAWIPPVDGDFSRPEINFTEMIFIQQGATVDGTLYLKRGHRCRLINCEFLGGDAGVPGIQSSVSIVLDTCAGTSIFNARHKGSRAALIRTTGGGELTMINCRAEGARLIPSWDFVDGVNITIIMANNEGTEEAPAVMRFLRCKTVTLLQPSLATTDIAMQDTGGLGFADGILLDDCSDVQITNPFVPGPFDQNGDGTARAIRSLSNCKNISVRGGYTSHDNIALEFDIQGEDCFVDVRCTGSPGHQHAQGQLLAEGLIGNRGRVGAKPGNRLRVKGGEGFLPGTDVAGPVDLDLGEEVGNATAKLRIVREVAGVESSVVEISKLSSGALFEALFPLTLLSPSTIDLLAHGHITVGLGPESASVSGALLFKYGDTNSTSFLEIREVAGAYGRISSIATGLRLYAASSILVLEAAAGDAFLNSVTGSVKFTSDKATPQFFFLGQGAATAAIFAMPHGGANTLDWMNSVTRVTLSHNGNGKFAFDGTGIAFHGVAPVAKPDAYTQSYATASRTHAAYAPDDESAAYTGAADGEAKLADLNALRVAYENLRASHESTKAVLNQLLDDLQAYGLLQ